MQVEETQFQQYASKMMNEVREREGPLKPLLAAAKEGAGILMGEEYNMALQG